MLKEIASFKEFELASLKADELLSLPPIMLEREEIDDVIAEDGDLDGYEHCNLLFMDINEDLKHNVSWKKYLKQVSEISSRVTLTQFYHMHFNA